MDDCLKSLPSEVDAIQHGDSLRALLPRGGFKISKWISNNRNVLETTPELERSKDIKNIDARKEELPVLLALCCRFLIFFAKSSDLFHNTLFMLS